MPEILILSGIPCSGKSSFREKLPYFVICRDDVRTLIFGKNYKYTRDNENRVTEYCNNNLFKYYTKIGGNILIDNTHCKDAYIQEWIKRAPSNYSVKIKFFDIPLYEAHLRNIFRHIVKGKWIPIKVMNDMYKNYQKLDKKKYEHMVYV